MAGTSNVGVRVASNPGVPWDGSRVRVGKIMSVGVGVKVAVFCGVSVGVTEGGSTVMGIGVLLMNSGVGV